MPNISGPHSLVEGGAVGHLSHLTDDRDLTFDQLLAFVRSAADGTLQNVTEKLDGMNLVYTVVSGKPNVVKVARAAGDISRGGMDATSLASKFYGRGNVAEAFNAAFASLDEVFSDIPGSEVERVFANGKRWYSMEIVYSKNPNVIEYDGDHIIFHEWPVFELGPDGKPQRGSPPEGGIAKLANGLKKKTSAGWEVHGPLTVSLQKMIDGTLADEVESTIRKMTTDVGIDSSSTIGEYLRRVLSEAAARAGVDPTISDAAVSRALEEDGAPTLTQLKKLSPKAYAVTKKFVDDSPKLISSSLRPLEIALYRFSVGLLRGIGSVLVKDHGSEVQRLRATVSQAIDDLSRTESESFLRQLEKLGDVSNVSAAMEGIVFLYGGNAYKFTGAFAPVNQILGMRRYGRNV